MTLDAVALMPWMQLLQFIGLLLLWLRKPGDDAEKKAVLLSARIDVLEERVKHMPTTDMVTELEGTVKAVNATLDALQGNFKSLQQGLARIETFMREQR